MVKKAVCFRAVMATTRFRRWSLGSQVAEIRDHTSWRVGEGGGGQWGGERGAQEREREREQKERAQERTEQRGASARAAARRATDYGP